MIDADKIFYALHVENGKAVVTELTYSELEGFLGECSLGDFEKTNGVYEMYLEDAFGDVTFSDDPVALSVWAEKNLQSMQEVISDVV